MREEVLKAVGIGAPVKVLPGDGVAVYSVAGGETAVRAWDALARRSEAVGGWPLLIGSGIELEYLTERFAHALRSEKALAQADVWGGLAPREILRAAKQLEYESLIKHNKEHPDRAAPEFMLQNLRDQIAHVPEMPAFDGDDWPAAREEGVGFHCLYDPLEKKFHEEAFIAIVRGSPATDVAAHMGFGGWNACPMPAVHVALSRFWSQHYSAIPVAMTHDTIECFVQKPPATREEAWKLAWAHEAYSEENYGAQGGTKELAQVLWKRASWLFWWD